ncbi:MAG: MarR family transcriptional regulator [Syntrophomonadaceae bacterium]|jgi:DNA-binding MarR family transcriptional regulator|nr:MarR family transcriptional regulator [Syntrophomonadaceae bacterium]
MIDKLSGYAEKIYVLVHHCHERCLQLMHAKKPDNEFSGLGIGIQQGIILKILLDDDGMTQKELTRKLQITSSSCGQLIGKLEGDKYVERRSHPDDRRTFNVYLTQSGRILGRRYKEKSIIVLEKWASDLTIQEKEQLYTLLNKLNDGLARQIKNLDY